MAVCPAIAVAADQHFQVGHNQSTFCLNSDADINEVFEYLCKIWTQGGIELRKGSQAQRHCLNEERKRRHLCFMVSSLIQRFAKILEVSDICLVEMGDMRDSDPALMQILALSCLIFGMGTGVVAPYREIREWPRKWEALLALSGFEGS